MPRRLATQLQTIATLLLYCIFSISITRAETVDTLPAKLAKLGYEQVGGVDKIQNYRVDGWNYIDNKHIMIYAGPSQRFLITTTIECPDLASAERIGFSSTATYITKFDKLVVRGTSGIVQNCPIMEMKTLQKIKHEA